MANPSVNEKADITNGISRQSLIEEIKEEENLGCWQAWKQWPKCVFCIVGNEFCERFNYYGMRVVLLLYLIKLGFNDNDSTAIYHGFTVLAYFSPILGSILADGYIGKFRTIFIISIVYACGSIIVAVASAIDTNNVHPWLDIIGLIVIAIGTGGIKPCVAPFGADQFKPGQEKLVAPYFSVFYASINAGSLISTIISPIFRVQRCLGESTCYPLSFGIPAVLMIVSVVIFLSGSFSYRKIPPKENVVAEIFKVMRAQFVEDIKALLRVLLMYLPVPIFWALFDQQGSRWLIQAVEMDYRIGSVTIPPEIIQILNPILILVFIPIFQGIVYPLCRKCGLNPTPLRRMVVGGVLAAVAFIIAGLLQFKVNSTLPPEPEAGHVHLSFVNTFPCNVTFKSNYGNGTAAADKSTPLIKINFASNTDIPWKLWTDDKVNCPNLPNFVNTTLTSGNPYYVVVTNNGSGSYVSDLKKPQEGEGTFKINVNYFLPDPDYSDKIIFLCKREDMKHPCNPRDPTVFQAIQIGEDKSSSFEKIKPGTWYIYQRNGTEEYVDRKKSSIHPIFLNTSFTVDGQGGVYSLTLFQQNGQYRHNLHNIVNDNTISILYQIPQYVVITAAEILFSITGLEFSYSQSSQSMKSVVQAAWLLTVSVGDCIIIIIAESNAFSNLAYELLLYAGIMLVFIIAYAFMCVFYYEYHDYKQHPEDDTNERETKNL